MFPFLSIAFRRMHFNQEEKPICNVVTVINGKIMLDHCLYISGLYIDTEARKIDSLPYAIIGKSNCYSHPFLGLFSFLL